MKPWLFDILACPIDKHFPLQLTIFSYETERSIIESFLNEYNERNIGKIKSHKIIHLSREQEQVYIKDNIVLEQKSMTEYLDLILASIGEMEHITDKSTCDVAKQGLNLILNDIRKTVTEFKNGETQGSIDEILPELLFINRMKIEVEISSGLLFCDKCNRWFPIIDTIPQMLPDAYREKKKDLQFLKANKSLIDAEMLKKELKPYDISS